MKRALGILFTFLLGACLTGVVLALTALRPRKEVVSTSVQDVPVMLCGLEASYLRADEIKQRQRRSREQVTHDWSLAPLRQWRFGKGPQWYACGPFGQLVTNGWQFGPFVFQEGYFREFWPTSVEKAARSALAKKFWANQATLSFQQLPDSWRVVARSPKGEFVAMDFREDGKPCIRSDRK